MSSISDWIHHLRRRRDGDEGDGWDIRLALIAVMAVGLLVGIVLSYIQAQRTEHRLQQLEAYVVEARKERMLRAEEQEDRSEELNRQTACFILDKLPASATLDSARAQFGCGPGIPIENLPPEIQQELAPRSPSSTEVKPAQTEAPGSPAAGVPTAPTAAPEATSPSPAQSPPPAGSPLIGPGLQTLCDTFGICP